MVAAEARSFPSSDGARFARGVEARMEGLDLEMLGIARGVAPGTGRSTDEGTGSFRGELGCERLREGPGVGGAGAMVCNIEEGRGLPLVELLSDAADEILGVLDALDEADTVRPPTRGAAVVPFDETESGERLLGTDAADDRADTAVRVGGGAAPGRGAPSGGGPAVLVGGREVGSARAGAVVDALDGVGD
jgi:hypothetical protein